MMAIRMTFSMTMDGTQGKGDYVNSNLLLHQRGRSGIFISQLPQGRGQHLQNPFSANIAGKGAAPFQQGAASCRSCPISRSMLQSER
jgi:dihydroxyacetone kinase-like predicted kinase